MIKLDDIDDINSIKLLAPDELGELAESIREKLIKTVSQNGGHLASNLGIVEITLALHFVFNSPADKLVFDVGHQSYVHKLLTGRRERFDTLRTDGGISGFPKREESEHDAFNTGHSSTSVSAALGLARARDLNGEKHHVVALIGDGAMTGGMSYEALNDAGHRCERLIIILNDNEMSISRNVGGLSRYLSVLRGGGRYRHVKFTTKDFLLHIPFIGKPLARGIEKFKNMIKYLLVPGIFFEDLGFTYLGPVDGHNIEDMISILEVAKDIKDKPVLVHAMTKKGRGYKAAETMPERYHGMAPFLWESPYQYENGASYSSLFGEALVSAARKDKSIVAITAAMTDGTGLTDFANEFPERFFDVGIAEQHAVTLAAGMAAGGLKPVFTVYSTFLQRSYDQILHDVCLQNLPVVLAIDRAGLVGEDGETHQGLYDIAFLSNMPNMTVLAPCFQSEVGMMLDFALKLGTPVAIRYPRGRAIISDEKQPLSTPMFSVLKDGKDGVILAVGRLAPAALLAALEVAEQGLDICVINVRSVVPLEEKLIDFAVLKGFIITIEEGISRGGFGSMVSQSLAKRGSSNRLRVMGVENGYIKHARMDEQLAQCGLDEAGITAALLEMATHDE